jgi:hypothetical protein
VLCLWRRSLSQLCAFRLGGNLLFLPGFGPRRADETMITGKVGADLKVELAV